jgi:CheY-like chemotaxis protein
MRQKVMAVTQCVLVVEDERKIRDLLRTYLEHDGSPSSPPPPEPRRSPWPAGRILT